MVAEAGVPSCWPPYSPRLFFRPVTRSRASPFSVLNGEGPRVEAYLRLASKKILARTSVTTPDHVVVQDQSLIQDIGVMQGLKPGGWILLNCPLHPSDMSLFTNYKVAIVDATSLALKNRIGSRTHPIVNTAMIGAFARMMEAPPMDTVIAAIRKEVPSDPDRNVAAAEEAYREVRLLQET